MLVEEFKLALLEALEKYEKHYVDNKLVMPDDRCADIEHFLNILKTCQNVLELRRQFITRYDVMHTNFLTEWLPFVSVGSLLRRLLRDILFDKKYNEEHLRNAYIDKLIEENNAKAVSDQREQALIIRISQLENDIAKMRQENQQLREAYGKVVKLNQTMRCHIQTLEGMLSSRYIPFQAFAVDEEDGFVIVDPINERLSNIGELAIDQFSINREDFDQLQRQSLDTQQLVVALTNKIENFANNNKEQVSMEEVKSIQKALEKTETQVQAIEKSYLRNVPAMGDKLGGNKQKTVRFF
ncbi:MAG TPA: hypothetical protein VHZ76_01800 [Gammaproteobacteria bacterium]|jgi:hypothetical protein|nr:hypothetical protein [Gammaproteobacteria bacterium]